MEETARIGVGFRPEVVRSGGADIDGVAIRLVRPDEAQVVADAVAATYGEGPAPIPGDPEDLAAQIAAGVLWPAVAEDADGTLLVMVALSRRSRHDKVAALACGITMEEAADRPQVYEAAYRHLVAQAERKGLCGVFVEVQERHAARRRVNHALGAHETGYLAGWRGTGGAKAQATTALLHLALCDAEPAPAFVPPRYESVVADTLAVARLGPAPAAVPRHVRIEAETVLAEQRDRDGGRAFVSVESPGSDVGRRLLALRGELADRGVDAVYADLPLDNVVTAVVGEQLAAAGFAYAGVFPRRRGALGLALRLQALGDVTVSLADVPAPTASGRHLLDFVVADLEATGHRFAESPPRAAGGRVRAGRRLRVHPNR